MAYLLPLAEQMEKGATNNKNACRKPVETT
jgi:hypothetical protein